MPPGPPEGDGFREDRFRIFVAKVDRLNTYYKEQNLLLRKLIRMLQAAGFKDPGELAQAVDRGLRPRPPTQGDALVSVVEHLKEAFPPEDIRGMAEDFLQGLKRARGRRRG